MARRALGKGLGALIPSKPASAAPVGATEPAPATEGAVPSGLVRLPLHQVHASPWQPRQVFQEEKLHELAESMREQGLIEPIIVRAVKAEDGQTRYEVIAGERRMRAAGILEWADIPAVIMEASDNRIREMALVENLQRDDLNAIEIALAYQALQDELHLTHENIAKRLGISSRSQITNTLRLLQLPEEVKSLVSEGRLAPGAARAILALPDPLSQIKLARKAVDDGLSVRDVEKLANRKPGGKSASSPAPERKPDADPQVRNLEERLGTHLGTRVRIQDEKGKGTIAIEYYSYDDVARILGSMGLAKE